MFIQKVSEPAYQPANTLNENVPLKNGRNEWAIIAAISQKYGMEFISDMVERRFMSGCEFASGIIRHAYDSVIKTIEEDSSRIEQYSERDSSGSVTKTVPEDISCKLMSNLRSLEDFGQDVYTRDYDIFKEYQDCLQELEGNVFLSFGKDMFYSLRFAFFKKYKIIVLILGSIQRILNSKKIMNVNPSISPSKGNSIDRQWQNQKKLEELLRHTRDTGDDRGFEALIHCDFQSGAVSYDVGMEKKPGRTVYSDPIMIPFIEFSFNPALNTEIEMFLQKIPNVISILEKLCEPNA